MAKHPRPLAGKVAVVTGGGRGIGRAIAGALARDGMRVAIGDLDAERARATAEALSSGAIGFPLDVTDRAGYTAFLDEVERSLGPIDVLVNNAGIMPVTAFDEEDDAMAIRQLELNLHAVLHGTKEAMRRMKPRGTGHIVNVASVVGKTGIPRLATYSACKHGVVGLSEAVRAELRGTGVEISVVMPASVSTELWAGLGQTRGFKASTPEEVAAAVVAAIEVPRFEVFVPRSIGPMLAVLGLLPRGAREAIARFIGADRVLSGADRDARAAYEARAALSAPAAEAIVEDAAAERRPRTAA